MRPDILFMPVTHGVVAHYFQSGRQIVFRGTRQAADAIAKTIPQHMAPEVLPVWRQPVVAELSGPDKADVLYRAAHAGDC